MPKRALPSQDSGRKRTQRKVTEMFGKPEANGTKKTSQVFSGGWDLSVDGLMIFEKEEWLKATIAAKTKSLLKIAAFDLDNTLIKTKSGNTFPRSPHDFVLLDSTVPEKLRSLQEKGYTLVIFSNQGGVGRGNTPTSFVQTRVELVMSALRIDMAVYVATNYDVHRKPSTGMWDELVLRQGGPEKVNKSESFYCGDAAGRRAKPGRRADFADSDLKLAINIGLKFITPEEVFRGEKCDPSDLHLTGFDPRKLVVVNSYFMQKEGDEDKSREVMDRVISPMSMVRMILDGACEGNEKPDNQCMILLQGPPASGKSSFVSKFLLPRGYVSVNLDTQNTFSKCRKLVKESFANGTSVVVDNTNPSVSSRAKYITLAKEYSDSIPIYCLKMEVSRELCTHLNILREASSNGRIPRIPRVAYNAYHSRFKEPSTDEGIAEIGTVKFMPYFRTEREKQFFTRLN